MTNSNSRQDVLLRLGALRTTKSHNASSTSSKRLKDYYERHVSKNSSGRLSQRRIDAFVGLCASCSLETSEISESELLDGLNEIANRWPVLKKDLGCQERSSLALKKIARSTYRAIFVLTTQDLSNVALEGIHRLISTEQSTQDSDEIPTGIVLLVAFLEVATESTENFSYSQFISTTRLLNARLSNVRLESPATASLVYEDLQKTYDLDRNYELQVQAQSARFILAWTENVCARQFSTTPERLWLDLVDTNCYVSDDVFVDTIVWQTAIEHAKTQYDLHNRTELSPISEQVLGYTLRIACLAVINQTETEDLRLLITWLNNLTMDAGELDDLSVGMPVIQTLATLALRLPKSSDDMSRMLKDIVQDVGRPRDDLQASVASLAAKELLKVLEHYSKDDLVSTMYHFSNFLNGLAVADGAAPRGSKNGSIYDTESFTSRSSEHEKVAVNAIEAISVFGTNCQDPQIASLALSILIQKSERVSDKMKQKIITELATVSLHCTEKDVLRLSTYYAYQEETTKDPNISLAIQCARDEVSSALVQADSPIIPPYLESLLRAGIQRASSHKSRKTDMSTVIIPLATLLRGQRTTTGYSPELVQLFHNFWFHLVIAGYTVNCEALSTLITYWRAIARGSPSLALATLTDSFESDLESYPILKQPHAHEDTKILQTAIENYIPGASTRGLGFSKAVYVNALALLENLRAQAGIASGSLPYYQQAILAQSDVSTLVHSITLQNNRYFLQSLSLSKDSASLDLQMAALVKGACSTTAAVRRQSNEIIDIIVQREPSAFCSSLAITTLLESVTLLAWACHEEYSDKYSPSYIFKSSRTDLTITTCDSFAERQANLNTVERNAYKWLDQAMLESAPEVRTLLTTYVTATEDHTAGASSEKGKMLAIEMAMRSSRRDQPADHVNINDSTDAFLGELTLRHLQDLSSHKVPPLATEHNSLINGNSVSSRSLLERSLHRRFIPFGDLREKLCSYVARILRIEHDRTRLIRLLVEIPYNIFTIAAMRLATSLWSRVATEVPESQTVLLAEISRGWYFTMKKQQGMFSLAVNHDDPFSRVMEYAPTDKEAIAKEGRTAKILFEPHLNILRFLSSRLSASQSINNSCRRIVARMMHSTFNAMRHEAISNHVFSRELRLRVLLIGMKLRGTGSADPRHSQFGARYLLDLYDAGLSMFANSPRWAFGSDVGQLRTDRQLISLLCEELKREHGMTGKSIQLKCKLLGLLLEIEISRLDLWLDPMKQRRAAEPSTDIIEPLLETAWKSNPSIAISFVQRFSSPSIRDSVRRMILKRPWQAIKNAHAAEYILGSSLPSDARHALPYLLYWTPVVPVTAATLCLPAFKSNAAVLQFALRSLESHPVEVTFFYVPQIVQVLRHDSLGYVRRFIIETAKLSQLFAHQIIWNFDANAYKDEDATIPDSIKPTLDSIKANMMSNLSGADKQFYETEFRFFGEVTSISGKLKPYIKKTKPEKKAKIDEEMAIIKVEQGVYLPSNPDGEVVDIERKSGRPLQSHAKAPFMATFKIRKSRLVEAAFENDLQVENNSDRQSRQQKVDVYEKKQSAIFKVGDDCRQDVLALQLISTFRSIFNSIGLDLYVFPYRVTATAPGCGVIDVLPNSISRDMLGREAVNGLYDYFITTFGKPETIAFQQARMNFVKSLAAYSVISYLLQFKDRHNGNIMYDAEGHILHIDFGFCFDIAPGGITFESAPFKLTTEMVAVMGGSTETQSYKMFQELCIKAFLVARQYSEQIIHLVTLMLDSGLPCFKGQTTITNLRNRFHLDATEQGASSVMLHLIAQSHLNQRTVAYDVFQKMTNDKMRSLLFFLSTVTAATLFRRESFFESVSRAVTKGFGPLTGGAATSAAPEQTVTVQIPELTAVVSLPGSMTATTATASTTLQAGQTRPGDAVVKAAAAAAASNSSTTTNATSKAKTNGPVFAGVAKPSDQLTKIVPSI